MPKPMSMTIEVEEMAFGKIFRTLDGMPGVVSINLKGSGPKKLAGMPAASKKNGGKTIPTILLEMLLASKSPVAPLDLGDVLQSQGKARTSLPDALTKLRRSKQIKKIGNGWKLTAAGIKAATTAKE